MSRDRSEGGGYVCIWRCIRQDKRWFARQRRPATELEAWMDLILRASFRDEMVLDQGESIQLHRGDVLTSALSLSEHWRWSQGKVRRFIKRCETDGELVEKVGRKRRVLRLCNYEKWQEARRTDGELTENSRRTDGDIQESESVKPVKQKNQNGYSPEFLEFWNLLPTRCRTKKPKAWALWKAKHPPIEAIRKAVEWQKAAWAKDDFQFFPRAEAYLNAGRWEDEPQNGSDNWSPIRTLRKGETLE